MIKINSTSDQELSKDDFIVKGNYTRTVKFLGIRLWSIRSKVDNKISKDNFKNGSKDVGFGKK